jgi:hypothetical protein
MDSSLGKDVIALVANVDEIPKYKITGSLYVSMTAVALPS